MSPPMSPMEVESAPSHAEEIVRFRELLALLLRAKSYALQSGLSEWEFAEEISILRSAGATHADLRWLVLNGWIAHAAEVKPTPTSRRFHKLHSLALPRNACFVLTEKGEAAARRLASLASAPPSASANVRKDLALLEGTLPRWDVQLRELWLGPLLVKRFRIPAQNQELVLTVFEEERWPARVDDPLPGKPERDAKRCLHDTINHLNRYQVNRVLRFAGDGTGRGIRWQAAGTVAAPPWH